MGQSRSGTGQSDHSDGGGGVDWIDELEAFGSTKKRDMTMADFYGSTFIGCPTFNPW